MKQYQQTNYYLNEKGEIFSKNSGELRKLATTINNKGYECITIYMDQKKVTKKLHRMLLETFKPTDDKSLQSNHIDGVKTNNHIDNLEWVTASRNLQHSYELNLREPRKGEKNCGAKLTEIQVKELKGLYLTGKYKQKELAEIFLISDSQVSRIVNNNQWKHL
jgi:plasmid maintenance system antidote protein VapI